MQRQLLPRSRSPPQPTGNLLSITSFKILLKFDVFCMLEETLNAGRIGDSV